MEIEKHIKNLKICVGDFKNDFEGMIDEKLKQVIEEEENKKDEIEAFLEAAAAEQQLREIRKLLR